MNKTKTDLIVTVVYKEEIAWRKFKRSFLKLQKRIFRAFLIGNIKAGRRLQKTLISSWSGKCLAIKQAISEFKYVQIKRVKCRQFILEGGEEKREAERNLKEKLLITVGDLARNLKLNCDCSIENNSYLNCERKIFQKIRDRALQIITEMALEPELKAKKQLARQSNCASVFVSGYSIDNTVRAIFDTWTKLDRPQVILQGKFQATALNLFESRSIETIKTFPNLSRQLKTWLKREVVIEKRLLRRNSKYKPKLEIVSLLSEIVFAEIQYRAIEQLKLVSNKQDKLIIDKDRLLLFHSSKQIVDRYKLIVNSYLQQLKLLVNNFSFSEINLFEQQTINKIDFDFLDFNFKQYIVNKNNCLKSDLKNDSSLKIIVTPTLDAKQKHFQELVKTIERYQSAPANILIYKLNDLLEKWVNYYSLFADKAFFRQYDRWLFIKLWNWAKYRHPRKSARFIWEKYWIKIGDRRFIFGVNIKNGLNCQLHSYVNLFDNKIKSTQIKRYVFEEPCEGKLSRTVLQPS
jgi:RNA-directed DNA polymerase